MESKTTNEIARDRTQKRRARVAESVSKPEGSQKEKRVRYEEADFSNKAAAFSNESENIGKGSFSYSESIDRTQTDSKDAYVSQLNTAVTDAARVASLLEEDLQLESVNAFFPNKIMALLDSGEEPQAMWWQPQGDSFCIVQANFDPVLKKHFQGTKFESFTRKLNRWGFRRAVGQKTPPGAVAYFHHDFLQGRPELIKEIGSSKQRVQANHERQRTLLMEEQKVSSQDWTGSALTAPPTRLLDLHAEEQRRATLANESQWTRDLLYSAPDHGALQSTLNSIPMQSLEELRNELALQLSAELQSTASTPQLNEATQAALNFSLGLNAASLGATYADRVTPRSSYDLLSNVLNPLVPSLEPPIPLLIHNHEVNRLSLAQYLEEARRMEEFNAAIRLQGLGLFNNSISHLPTSFPFMTPAESLSATMQAIPYPELTVPQGTQRIDASSTHVPPLSTNSEAMPGASNLPISHVPGRLERSELLSPAPTPAMNTSSTTPIDVERILELYVQQQQQARPKDDGNT